MVDERRRVTSKPRRQLRSAVGCVALAMLVAACTPPMRRLGPIDGPWQQTLAGSAPVVVVPMPASDEPLMFPPGATVMVVAEDARAAELPFSPDQRRALREFVAAGGRLLLLGHATALAAAIGVEDEWPEATTFRWGFDRRAGIGRARLGVHVVSGKAPELFEALQAATGHEETFFVAGGEPCTVPLCSWSVGAPRGGEVLARLATELDGELADIAGPVVVRWTVGHGEVLACGLLPALDHVDPTVRSNARTFVNGCVRWLQRRHAGPVVMLRQLAADAPVPAPVQAAFAPRTGPQTPLLSHWGWQAAPRESDADSARSVRELVGAVLVPSWLAGADLLELQLGGGGVVLPWSDTDPLKRPPTWRAGDASAGLGARDVAELAGEAHARGMLLAGAFDPLPVGERKGERLAALRFVARELACVRRLGAGAIDGFGVRTWWRDDEGYGPAMVQDFQPAAFVYGGGECAGELAGGVRALDADDGAPRGSTLAGISGAWRDGFPADRFPLGVLDARAQREAGAAVSAVAGGGTSGDWIVTQANDFVRDRRGLGGALWWRRHDPALFDATTVAYVHGVSQEPLVAAVAMSLAATGSDGRRAATAALLDPAPAGFGAETPVPAAVHVLQNNWFSLAGSGGALRYDDQGLARFRAGESAVVAQSFLRTRLFGARPDGDVPLDAPVDLLAGGRRGEGGYGRIAQVRDDAGARAVPALIAGDARPAWPAGIALDWRGPVGYHELELTLRSVRGSGVVAISLDGALARCVPFRSGAPAATVTVPMHEAGPGARTLQIEVVEGGAVAIDALRTIRRGEVGVQARVVVPAGSHASLEERSESSVHGERVDLLALADFPGFLLRFACERAVRNLQVERTFALGAHTQLVGATDEQVAAGLREPFVLRAPAGGLPDVVVVPMQLARHERFELGAEGLVMRSAPEAGMTSRIGFLFCERRQSEVLRRSAATMLGALDRPLVLDLTINGTADLTNELPVGWPRLVHLPLPPTTPLLVRENGWWTWRGMQQAPDGGAWLRIRHERGDTVQVVGGPAVFARTRPGPGSLHTVALRDPEPLRVTVKVVQPSVLCAPSVVMGQAFDEVRVDGEPWAWFDGRTVFLPDRPGTYRIECRTRAGGALPHVLSTRAPLVRCAYDSERRELVLVVPPGAGRPVELPWTAVLSGPRPSRIENGEVVGDDELRHRDPEAAAAARAGGVLIRFRSGTTRVSQ